MPTDDEIKALVKKAFDDHMSVYLEFSQIDLKKEQEPLLPFFPEYFDEPNMILCEQCGVLYKTEEYRWNCPNCNKLAPTAPEWAKDDE